MLKADDPKIGMLGFMSYLDFDPIDKRGNLGLGSAVLVIEADDIDAVAARACKIEGMSVTGPVQWQVPSAAGKQITLNTVSLRDPDGLYFEVSASRG